MLVKKAFKFRLFPTEEQAILINKTIGCSRFVFNHFLDSWQEAYRDTGKGLSYYVVLLSFLRRNPIQSYTTKYTNNNIAVEGKNLS